MDIKRLKVPSKRATEYLKNDKELSQYWEQLNRDCYGEIIIDSDTLDHIGHVFVWHTKRDKGFIFNLEVKPQYRRQGIGWILLDDAVKKYNGIDLLVDEDNIPAIKLYEKYGFETIKTVNGQLWMKLNQIKQEGVIMFFDRLGNAVTGEEQPIIEEPVVESYYDPNRPVRPGFEKPEMFQEGLFDMFKPKPNKETNQPTTIEDVETMHDIVIDKDFKKFITENPDGCKFKYPDNKIVSKEILEFIDDEDDPTICSLNQFIDANCEYDGCIEISDYCLYIGGWIDDKALYLATNKSSCAPEGSIIFADVIENGYDYTDRIFAKSFKDFLKNANIEKDINEYSEMDLDEMSDYITEANEESKKARKNAQEFMRNEYGTSHPTSMTSKQRNRMKKWLKDNDYDPKTKTIKTDIIDKKTGKNFRVNIGTNEINSSDPMPMPFAITPQMAHELGEKKWKKLTHDGRSYINMPKSYMKRHPSISTGISKHEEGHVADLQYKRPMAGEKLANIATEYGKNHGLAGDYHSNPAEYKADIYSATHNKYKDKLRSFNAITSKDITIQRLSKKRIENGMMKIDKMYGDREYEKSVPDYERIVVSSKEDIIESCQHIIDSSQDMVKMYNEMISDGSLEGLDSEQVAAVKQSLVAFKAQLRDARDLLKKVENVSFEQGRSISKQHDIEVMMKACNSMNEKLDEVLDTEAKLRKLVVKTFLKEFAIEYNMSTVDVIQEMYQTAFEDYVFQEDFEDEEPFDYDVYLEAKIDAAERNELDDEDFGLVYTDENDEEIRKYPLTDKIHIQKAVQFFDDCPDDYKPLLAHNILKKAKKFNIDSSNWDRINKANEKYSDED